MKTKIVCILLFSTLTYTGNSQIFVSDSIAYKYFGNLSEEDGKKLLSQFRLKDIITKLPWSFPTQISRDGDFISIETPQGPILESTIPSDFTPNRIKILSLTIQNKAAIRDTIINDGTHIKEQMFFGDIQAGVYHIDTKAFVPLTSIDSPYVTIIWRSYDYNKDNKIDHLRLCIINSRDIGAIYYCQPK